MDDNTNIFAALVDLETTGLDANRDIPLEFGIKLIDKEGFVLAAKKSLVWEAGEWWKDKIMAGQNHSFVGPMHEASGLWDDLWENGSLEGRTRAKLDTELCDFLDSQGVRIGTVPMMGNSVGSLDRPFCLVHFPKFSAHLHYRNLDMSTIKVLCEAHNPELFENLKPIIGTKADAKHRVWEDIDACIVEYRAYLDNFLITASF